jgi:hypothetical protein
MLQWNDADVSCYEGRMLFPSGPSNLILIEDIKMPAPTSLTLKISGEVNCLLVNAIYAPHL